MNKELKFAPGAFDDFEGSQQELESFIAELTDMFVNGVPSDNVTMVNMTELEEENPELYEKLMGSLVGTETERQRKLN